MKLPASFIENDVNGESDYMDSGAEDYVRVEIDDESEEERDDFDECSDDLSVSSSRKGIGKRHNH